MLERINNEIKRRTRVATLFPNEQSALRLVTAVLMESAKTGNQPHLRHHGNQLIRPKLKPPNYRRDIALSWLGNVGQTPIAGKLRNSGVQFGRHRELHSSTARTMR
jgi:hypothetical protein